MMYSLNFRIFLASFLFMLCLGGAVHGLISSIEESPKSEIKSDIITTDDDDDSRGGRFYGNERSLYFGGVIQFDFSFIDFVSLNRSPRTLSLAAHCSAKWLGSSSVQQSNGSLLLQ